MRPFIARLRILSWPSTEYVRSYFAAETFDSKKFKKLGIDLVGVCKKTLTYVGMSDALKCLLSEKA
jgi:hypothetical protein